MNFAADAKTGQALDKNISDRIRLARIICILTVVYAHAPPYLRADFGDADTTFLVVDAIRNSFARVSVPLLSIISGYLAVKMFERKTWLKQVSDKVWTLVVPLVLWNLIALAIDTARSGPPPLTIETLNAVLSLYSPPAVEPLYFLRDMFVCTLVVVPVLKALRVAPWPFLLLCFVDGILDLDGVLLVNSQILFFFVFGCLLSMQIDRNALRHIEKYQRYYSAAGLLMVVQILLLRVFQDSGAPETGLRTFLINLQFMMARLGGAILFWHLTAVLSRRRLGRILPLYEPIIFFVFCAHPLLISATWKVATAIGIHVGSALYMGFFLFVPIIVLFESVVGVACLANVAAWAARWLLAGKVPSNEQLLRMIRAPLDLVRPVAASQRP